MDREFYSTNTVSEAVLLKDCNSAYLAGGTEINRLKSGFETKSLISIKRIGLNCIDIIDNQLRIGSTVTFQNIIDSKIVPSYLKKACSFMASRTKRNMATIGGNIALKRFDSYLIPTLAVSNAKLYLQNKYGNTIEVSVIDYINNNNDYIDLLILYVIIPDNLLTVRSKRCSNTVLSHAFVTVALSFDGKKYNLFAGLKNSGFVHFNTLSIILNKKTKLSLDDIHQLINTTNEIQFYDDIYGSIDYKKYILAASIYELYSEIRGDK